MFSSFYFSYIFRNFPHVIFSLHFLKKTHYLIFIHFAFGTWVKIWVFLLLQLHLQFEELKRYDTDWKKQSPVAKGLNRT